jgi:hypothetical protein
MHLNVDTKLEEILTLGLSLAKKMKGISLI